MWFSTTFFCLSPTFCLRGWFSDLAACYTSAVAALSHDPTPVVLSGTVWRMVRRCIEVSGIHPEFSFPVIPDMFTYPERCPPALSVNVLTHPDP